MSQQPFIQKLTLRNFRSIRNETVTFANPLFLVGRNGSGKSNFVDALAFISECADRPLQYVFNVRGGSVFTFSQRSGVVGIDRQPVSPLAVRVDYNISGTSESRGHYALQISHSANDYAVDREQCVTYRDDGEKTWFDRKGTDFRSNVSGIKPSVDAKALVLPIIGGVESFAPVTKALAMTRVYALDPNVMRRTQDIDVNTSLNKNGSNIASVLQRLNDQHTSSLARIAELLGSVLPDVTAVSPVLNGGKIFLAFAQGVDEQKSTGRQLVFLGNGMSDGTLYALGIIIAALQDPAPSLIAIEEPELNIHPGALDAIADILNIAAQRTQVVVTTHSPDLLDTKWLTPENLRVVQWEDGATNISELGEAPVKALQQHLMGAGELLRANALDAAPSAPDSEDVADLFESDLA